MKHASLAFEHQQRLAPPRNGLSLLEMAAVIAVNAVLVAIALSLIMTFVRADDQMATRSDRRLQLSPLMRQVRTDLRAAAAVRVEDGELTMETPKRKLIRYRRRGDDWVRAIAANNGDGETAGVYRLPAGTKLAMTPESAAAGEVVRLEWRLPSAVELPNREPPPADELVVAVGSDGRLLHP